MGEPDDTFRWLYRGVPFESSERNDVLACGDVEPPRPDLICEHWRQVHVNDMTTTAYTSWTTERSIAVLAAEASSAAALLSGRFTVFRVARRDVPLERQFPGRDDEHEVLIEGTVEHVQISAGESQDDEED